MKTSEDLETNQPFDEHELNWIREIWFERAVGTLKPGDSRYEDTLAPVKEFWERVWTLEYDESLKVIAYIMDTIPTAEFEAAVTYLKQTVSQDSLRDVYDILDADRKSGTHTRMSYAAEQNVRNLLRKGGFTWNTDYLDNCAEMLLHEAVMRFAKETGLADP